MSSINKADSASVERDLSEGFDGFYRRHKPDLLVYAERRNARDPELVVDLALFDLYQARKRLRNHSPKVYWAYLYRAADSHMAQERRREVPEPVENPVSDSGAVGFEDCLVGRLSFDEEMAQLTPSQAEAVRLQLVDGLSSEGAGSVMGLSASATRQLQYRALASLRVRYGVAIILVVILGAAMVASLSTFSQSITPAETPLESVTTTVPEALPSPPDGVVADDNVSYPASTLDVHTAPTDDPEAAEVSARSAGTGLASTTLGPTAATSAPTLPTSVASSTPIEPSSSVAPATSVAVPVSASGAPDIKLESFQGQAVGHHTRAAFYITTEDNAPARMSVAGLPAGLERVDADPAVNSRRVVVAGKPTEACRCQVTVTATDSAGRTSSRQFIWEVTEDPDWGRAQVHFLAMDHRPRSVGVEASSTMRIEAAGGGPVTVSASGLPDGVTLRTPTLADIDDLIELRGVSTEPCRCLVKVSITDASGLSGYLEFEWIFR